MVLLEAHRGVCTRYPENTIAAFKGALQEGYDVIELDMRFSKDDRPVIIHDGTINRTARKTDGSVFEETVAVNELTFEELRSLDVGCWFDASFGGEKTPTVTEVVNFSNEHKIPLKFDNKLQTFSQTQQDIFFEEAKIAGFQYGGFTAGKLKFVERIAEKFPDCEIHYDGEVTRENLEAVKKLLKNNTLYIWLPIKKMSWLPYPPADKEMVDLAKEYGKVGIWILTEEEQLKRAIELGADMIETDGSITPDMLKAVMKGM